MNAAGTSGRNPAQRRRSELACRVGATLLAMLTAGTTAPPAAGDHDEEVHGLLHRMVQASRSLDYIGMMVYRAGSLMRPMKVIHRGGEGPNGKSRERLVALAGAPREVIREGDRVLCILLDERTVLVAKREPGRLDPSYVFEPEVTIDSGIAEFYHLSTSGVERVADREATVIDVRPKDRYRYGYQLAVDRETGLLLKSELLDDEKKALEEIIYMHLELPESIPDKLLEPGISYDEFEWREVDAPEDAGRGTAVRPREWTVGWLPTGFTLMDESYRLVQPGSNSVDHRVYGDGLASLSIFIEEGVGAAERFEGFSSVGAINAFGRVVGEFHLNVVGEVPAVTVKKIAASITMQ